MIKKNICERDNSRLPSQIASAAKFERAIIFWEDMSNNDLMKMGKRKVENCRKMLYLTEQLIFDRTNDNMFYENEGTEKSLTYFWPEQIKGKYQNKEVFFVVVLSFCFYWKD